MIIREVNVRHILTASQLTEYCINPYTGCQHACVYCYADFMKRFSSHTEPWGQFVDVKINASEVLEKDLSKIKQPSPTVLISSVTDAYQPIEQKYRITRSILEKIAAVPADLLHNKLSVQILTKSDLVLRDLDILLKIENCRVGFSIGMTDEHASRLLEPCCSPIQQRINALKILHDNGIYTFAFIAPILPGITDLPDLFAKLAGKVDFVFGETLNLRCGNLPTIFHAVSRFRKELLPRFEQDIRDQYSWLSVSKNFYELAKSYDIPVTGFVQHRCK